MDLIDLISPRHYFKINTLFSLFETHLLSQVLRNPQLPTLCFPFVFGQFSANALSFIQQTASTKQTKCKRGRYSGVSTLLSQHTCLILLVWSQTCQSTASIHLPKIQNGVRKANKNFWSRFALLNCILASVYVHSLLGQKNLPFIGFTRRKKK